jgi:hypothetical protein
MLSIDTDEVLMLADQKTANCTISMKSWINEGENKGKAEKKDTLCTFNKRTSINTVFRLV